MDMSGEQRIPAPQQAVWDALNDPETLKVCIPGCESVEKLSDTQFTAKVVMAVGPVKAKFSGEVTLSDIDAPNSCTLSGKGSGGAAGFGKGSAKITLTPEDGMTVLRYTAQASVGGKIAQIGQRLVDSTAKKLADEFFARFNAEMAKRHEVAGAPETVAAPAGEIPAPVPTEAPAAAKQGGAGKYVWIGIAAVAAAVIIWFVSR